MPNRGLRYNEVTMKLTPQETQLFRHNGFIKFPTRLTKEHVDSLKAQSLSDMKEEIEPLVRKDGRAIRISNVWGRGGIFRETIQCNEIMTPLESLLGPNIEFLLNRHNHVYLRDQDSTASLKLHRDVRQWSRTIVTILIYLEDTHLENGCTRIIPGSHLLTSLPNDIEAAQDQVAVRQAIPLPMPAGGLLAIDSMVLHAAGVNRTEGTRLSMTLGYHSVDEFAEPDEQKRVLVRGERVYDGNDQ